MQRLIFIEEIINFRVTQKDSIFLGDMTDIDVSALKYPELTRKHMAWALKGGEGLYENCYAKLIKYIL